MIEFGSEVDQLHFEKLPTAGRWTNELLLDSCNTSAHRRCQFPARFGHEVGVARVPLSLCGVKPVGTISNLVKRGSVQQIVLKEMHVIDQRGNRTPIVLRGERVTGYP